MANRQFRQVEKSIGERFLRSTITPTMVRLEHQREQRHREQKDELQYFNSILCEIESLRRLNVDAIPFKIREPELFQELSDDIVRARSHQLYPIQDE